MISNLINKTQTKGGLGVDDTKNQHRKHKLIEYANGKSLEEINGTVEVPRGKGFWRTLFAYSGPGALVAVGYMDPGNWSTSITGGQSFQYTLMTFHSPQYSLSLTSVPPR